MEIGDKMPLFEAPDQDGRIVKSESLIGKKAVLYAYPADMTPGCTAEACNLADNYQRFLAQGYQVVGISKNSVASHRKFADKYSLPFTLLSDPEHTVLEMLGAWGEKKSQQAYLDWPSLYPSQAMTMQTMTVARMYMAAVTIFPS